MTSKKIDYLNFFKLIGKSKRLTRRGWARENVYDPESVAEHSFRVGVLAMILADKFGYKLDKDKLIKMALLHDLGELITGDIVAARGEIINVKKRDEKEKKEREGIKKIFDQIGESKKFLAIFDEMIGRTTPEAKIFWQLDKLEMAIQALEYEEEQEINLQEFFDHVGMCHLSEALTKEIFDNIIIERKKNESN